MKNRTQVTSDGSRPDTTMDESSRKGNRNSDESSEPNRNTGDILFHTHLFVGLCQGAFIIYFSLLPVSQIFHLFGCITVVASV